MQTVLVIVQHLPPRAILLPSWHAFESIAFLTIESFGLVSQGPGWTFRVQTGPHVVSFELETFSPAASLTQILATKIENAKTPRARTLGVLCKLREPESS